ncbi:MAG: DUF86 domain-containing protein [Sphingomonadaceae bacterium]
MSSSNETVRIGDILRNAEHAIDYVGALSMEAFADDALRVDATERCIERICEAAIKIGTDRLHDLRIDLDSAALRGLGNVLRHEYDAVDGLLIYDIVRRRLPPLCLQCERALATLSDSR